MRIQLISLHTYIFILDIDHLEETFSDCNLKLHLIHKCGRAMNQLVDFIIKHFINFVEC